MVHWKRQGCNLRIDGAEPEPDLFLFDVVWQTFQNDCGGGFWLTIAGSGVDIPVPGGETAARMLGPVIPTPASAPSTVAVTVTIAAAITVTTAIAVTDAVAVVPSISLVIPSLAVVTAKAAFVRVVPTVAVTTHRTITASVIPSVKCVPSASANVIPSAATFLRGPVLAICIHGRAISAAIPPAQDDGTGCTQGTGWRR